MAESSGTERHQANTSTSLDMFSSLVPDADPAVLLATANEFTKFADAIYRMKELGLVEDVLGFIALTNDVVIPLNFDNETEE